MFLIAGSAAFVGLVHSLAPGHWLPVLLTVKSQRWPLRKAVLGALLAASGHVILSVIFGAIVIKLGAFFLSSYEEQIEGYGGLVLVAFGLIYGGLAYFRHSSCHHHHHHDSDGEGSGRKKMSPYLFLFSLGFSPCVAVLPVFAAAATQGHVAVILSMIAFSLGVITALVSATVLVSLGIMKLDHPILEHYGDVITGAGVALMGLVLFFYPH
jgi:cytochrome c biogenesis protein CcdA